MRHRYLITGATGFVGSILVRRLLAEGEEVHLLIRKSARLWRLQELKDKVTFHYSDLSDLIELQQLMSQIRPTVIYHLAAHGAYSYQNNANEIIHTNIFGTWNLLQACNTIDYDLFVNTGSSSEYGFKTGAIKETDLLEPASYYAASKCAQTLLCAQVAEQEKKPIVTLRPFSVYGPYEEPTRLIPTLMKRMYTGKPMDLVNQDIAHDYIYVDDLVAAYLKIDALKQYRGHYFNIGTGIQSSIREVVESAVSVTGKTTQFNWGGMPSRSWDTTHWVADISKAQKLLHWRPKVSLAEGLKKTWDWYVTHNELYV